MSGSPATKQPILWLGSLVASLRLAPARRNTEDFMDAITKHRTLFAAAAAALLLLALATALARKFPAAGTAVVDQAVTLNTKTLIYHCPACDLVRRCGADCVTVDMSEARRRGAKPCAACGGDCLARTGAPSGPGPLASPLRRFMKED